MTNGRTMTFDSRNMTLGQISPVEGYLQGLYESVARSSMPSVEETAALDFDFPSAHEFKDFRGVMIGVSRLNDFQFRLKGTGGLDALKDADQVPRRDPHGIEGLGRVFFPDND